MLMSIKPELPLDEVAPHPHTTNNVAIANALNRRRRVHKMYKAWREAFPYATAKHTLHLVRGCVIPNQYGNIVFSEMDAKWCVFQQSMKQRKGDKE